MSKDRIDFEGEPWSAHRQGHWLDFAGRPDFPDYLRIAFVAYGRHRANGHARLDREELAHLLVRQDGTLPERRTIWAALKKAVALGFLLEESKLLCLVVSSDHAQGGTGKRDAPCPRDHTVRSGNVGSDDRHKVRNVGKRAGRFAPNVGSDDRRSTPTPSISLELPRQREAHLRSIK